MPEPCIASPYAGLAGFSGCGQGHRFARQLLKNRGNPPDPSLRDSLLCRSLPTRAPEHFDMYRLSYIEGEPRRYRDTPMRPLAKPRTEQFTDEESPLARAEVILLDGRFNTVSLSDGENIVTEPRLRIQLGL
jgi:hypothetical protein